MDKNFTQLNEHEKIYRIINNHIATISRFTKYKIGSDLLAQLVKKYKTPELLNIALITMRILPQGVHFTEKELFKIIDYNFKFKKVFEKHINNIKLGNNFKLQYTPIKLNINAYTNQHVDSPFQIEIYKKDKKTGSFNFIFTFENNKKKLRITLIQGEKNNKSNIKDLNKLLGNWRQKIVENLVDIAKNMKAEPIGELPKKYIVPNLTKEQYFNLIKNDVNSYIHGGIKQENICVKRVHADCYLNITKYIDNIYKNKKVKNKKLKIPLWKKHIKHLK